MWENLGWFLSEPWWAGVSAIATIVALAAVAIAAIDFAVRRNDEAPKALAFEKSRTGIVYNGEYEIEVKVRVMGSHVIYEPFWQISGRHPQDHKVLPFYMDVRSEPVGTAVTFRQGESRDVWVGLAWVDSKRRARACGSRLNLESGEYQSWSTYRWRIWPRKSSGRWRSIRERRGNSRLNVPTM